ncbi:hypothetical protein CsmBV13.6 [Diolcogaster facetosa bracovirus]|uniref:Uncharacterized protein n=1 Tax=Bracoviriform facetosae TaxID=2083300 RepID=R9XL91_9VIRU|nr:hypothetical protein CsmBV13.6 [Diolcogaster facetosa bracovirus] [Bracoviriform facetosae]AGO14477.1 hypothetical protein CsmBV13.6 [Diolcogaster facetosa bracovirus] [Bracoviriform facetosae]
MVFKKSVLILWVQVFSEHRGEFHRPLQFSDSTIQNDNDIESHRITAPRTPRVYESNDVTTAAPTKDELSEATPTHSGRKPKVRLNVAASLELIYDVYETNDKVKNIWASQSTLERSHLLNLRQTFCNVVTNVYMPLDEQVIHDVLNVICSPLRLANE